MRDLYLEGLDLLISGHRKKAYKYFKEIVDQDTTNIKSYIKMGQIVRESKNPKQALKIHTSVSLRTDLSKYERVELHKNISLDYYDLKDIVHAVDECLYILKIDKNNDWAILQLIKYFIESENWQNTKWSPSHKCLVCSIYIIRLNIFFNTFKLYCNFDNNIIKSRKSKTVCFIFHIYFIHLKIKINFI